MNGTEDPIQISFYAVDWRGSTLSNMTPTPLVFRGVPAACVEAIVQSMNFPFDDKRHLEVLGEVGPACKSRIYEAEAIVSDTGLVFWDGVSFPVDSDARRSLLRGVIRAKFETNKLAWEALRLSDGRSFEYVTSPLDEVLSVPSLLMMEALGELLNDIRTGALPLPK